MIVCHVFHMSVSASSRDIPTGSHDPALEGGNLYRPHGVCHFSTQISIILAGKFDIGAIDLRPHGQGSNRHGSGESRSFPNQQRESVSDRRNKRTRVSSGPCRLGMFHALLGFSKVDHLETVRVVSGCTASAELGRFHDAKHSCREDLELAWPCQVLENQSPTTHLAPSDHLLSWDHG